LSVPSSQGVAGPPEVPGYSNLSPLGSGAYSTVYRATVENNDATVAIKVLAGKPASESERLNFEREVGAMADLAGHPYVVELIDSGTTADGRPFLVMPVYPHGTMGAMVESDGPISWIDLLDVGIKLASAVESVHRSGFVHRDIKPANIFRSTDMTDPVLADFGVSSFVAPSLDGPATVAVAATPIFAAPEVLNGQRPTTLSDIYALGTLLFGLVEGRPAYAQQSIEMVVQRVTGPDPVPTITADAPPELRKLIARMMAKRPIARPPTALDVARTLAAIQRGHKLPPTPIMVLTDGVLEELPPVPRSADTKPTSRRTPEGGITSASTVDLDEPEPFQDQPATAEPGVRRQQAGQRSDTDRAAAGASLTDQVTVSVDPSEPPTQTLPDLTPPPKQTKTYRPSLRWPIIVGLASLAVFVFYWVATGRSLGNDDTESPGAAALTVTPELSVTHAAHNSLVGTLAWSTDGSRLFSAGRDGQGQLWAIGSDGQLQQSDTLEVEGWVLAAAWSTDDLLAVGTSTGQISIWAPGNNTPVVEFLAADDTVEALDWHPTGNDLAAAAGDGSIEVWTIDNDTAASRRSFPARSAAVLAVAWSPNGHEIAAGGKGRQAVVWDAETGDELITLPHDDWVRDLAWSPTGVALATADGSGGLGVWERETGEELYRATVTSDPVAGIEWSPTGPLMLTGTEAGNLVLWSIGDGEPQTLASAGPAVTSVAWSPDATTWAVGRGDGSVEIWTTTGDGQP